MAPLGEGVSGVLRDAREGGHARHVDDVRFVGVPEQGQEVVAAVDDAVDVDADDPADVVERVVGEPADGEDAGVVDEDVAGPVVGGDLVGELGHAIGVRHVDDVGRRLGAAGLDGPTGGGEAVEVDVDQGQGAASTGELEGGGAADAAPGARDDRDAVFEVPHRGQPSLDASRAASRRCLLSTSSRNSTRS